MLSPLFTEISFIRGAHRRNRLTQLRLPLIRASSCWLYSIIFVAVYGSIRDPFHRWHRRRLWVRVVAFRSTSSSTTDTCIVCLSSFLVTVAQTGFHPDHSVSLRRSTDGGFARCTEVVCDDFVIPGVFHLVQVTTRMNTSRSSSTYGNPEAPAGVGLAENLPTRVPRAVGDGCRNAGREAGMASRLFICC